MKSYKIQKCAQPIHSEMKNIEILKLGRLPTSKQKGKNDD